MRLSREDFIPVLSIMVAGAVGLFATGSLLLSSRADHIPPPVRTVVPSQPVWSPDGSSVMFESRQFVRATPAVSPDGRWIAFESEGRLMTVPLEGGEPVYLRPLSAEGRSTPGN
jgi:hypothetical protein